MSKVAIKGNPLGTGTFTIEAPNSDTDSTVLLPVGGGSVVLTEAAQTLTNKSISASQVNSGTLDSARIPDLAASKITSGTIATARLASGTADSTTFLRGDQTWATVAGGVTSLNGQTGAITNTSLYAIGSNVIGRSLTVTTNYAANDTLAGSSLYNVGSAAFRSYSSNWLLNNTTVTSPATPAAVGTGTWRCLTPTHGYGGSFPEAGPGLWVRIS